MVKKLLHTRYRVADLDKTISFYKDVLGLAEVRRIKSPRGSELVFLKAPESEELIEICCYPASGPVVIGPDLTHLAFEVEDMEAFEVSNAALCSAAQYWPACPSVTVTFPTGQYCCRLNCLYWRGRQDGATTPSLKSVGRAA